MGEDAGRHPLVGSWKLISFELRLPNGGVAHPFGPEPRGYLFYNEQGFMSAAFMGAERVKPQSADLADTSKTVNYDQFNAYCGRFEAHGDRVVHHVEVASLPQWCGVDQERIFKIDGRRLILETPPLAINAQAPTGYLIWERV